MLSKNKPSQSDRNKLSDIALLGYANQLGFGELHFKLDAKTGLQAIVAIHSTKLGPSLGGCRFREYATIKDAVWDAMRLAHGMSYKAAMTGLPLGGGKSVIIKPIHPFDRDALFVSFGEFIENLGGRYITAVDSGTTPFDMDNIGKSSRHVTSKSSTNGDPSPFTARGVVEAIKAAYQVRHNRNSIEGIHVAIQGIGHVGRYLAEYLYKLGVKLTVADIHEGIAQRCAKEFNAEVVSIHDIHKVDCDVFSPCALGAIINDKTIPAISADIIVGSANNQLEGPHHGEILHKKGILYGPDYVVNAGGLIFAYAQYFDIPIEEVNQKVANIYKTTLTIFERSAKENRPPSETADEMAEERLNLGDKV